MFDHPKYLKNQVWLEIKQTVISLPIMSLFTAPIFWLEVQGYGKLYDTTADGPGLWYNIIQFPFFIAFTDCFIYWIHRGLHYPMLYKRLHKPHHKWIVPTPYASHAFHPIDGFAQSVPYHVFPFLFPLQKYAYVVLFVFINIWTILIHDGEYVANSPIVNGAACHTLHHLYFNFNYGMNFSRLTLTQLILILPLGQFTTLWDRMGGSYRQPNAELFGKTTKTSQEEWTRQTKEMEKLVTEVEGDDDRSYLPDTKTKKVQ
jgi:lathosterol oxidase